MADVLGMGAALLDVLAEVDENFLKQFELQKGHMHLINAIQAAKIEAMLGSHTVVSGGSAANTCVGYQLFGGQAAFMGRVAEDHYGRAFADSISQTGLEYINLRGTTSNSTGVCYALITPDGERTMCTWLGASGDFGEASVTIDMFADHKLLYLEGYIWDTGSRAAAADLAIKTVRANGGQVGFTLSDGWVVDAHHETFMRYLTEGAVDVLFANESEICALTKTSDFESAAKAAQGLAKTLVLTRSEKGAHVYQGAETVHVEAPSIARLVDATGAGDLFAAGFLYGYLNGYSLQKAAAFATAAAGEVISHIGARPQKDLKTFVN